MVDMCLIAALVYINAAIKCLKIPLPYGQVSLVYMRLAGGRGG